MEQDRQELSVVGRLIAELAWEGSKISDYYGGGSGRENVLTAEVLLALDFLPRTAFLGSVLAAAHGADATRARLIAEIEDAKLDLLPGEITLARGHRTSKNQIAVQPDGVIETSGVRCLLEAKRIKSSQFQRDQLAREYVASIVRRNPRQRPLLLLLLGKEPPVKVDKIGRVDVADAIDARLPDVLETLNRSDVTVDVASHPVEETVCWVTWAALSDTVAAAAGSDPHPEPSVQRSIERLAKFVNDAVERHS